MKGEIQTLLLNVFTFCSFIEDGFFFLSCLKFLFSYLLSFYFDLLWGKIIPCKIIIAMYYDDGKSLPILSDLIFHSYVGILGL